MGAAREGPPARAPYRGQEAARAGAQACPAPRAGPWPQVAPCPEETQPRPQRDTVSTQARPCHQLLSLVNSFSPHQAPAKLVTVTLMMKKMGGTGRPSQVRAAARKEKGWDLDSGSLTPVCASHLQAALLSEDGPAFAGRPGSHPCVTYTRETMQSPTGSSAPLQGWPQTTQLHTRGW